MDDTKHGGPAFPSPEFAVPADMRKERVLQLRNMRGMTLRDYFAAKAMQGWFANPDSSMALPCGVSFEESQKKSCRNFYEWADAMLAARSAT